MNIPCPPRLLALLILCLCAFADANAQTAPTRIMPLGDSITNGFPVAGGYRNRLHQLLTAAGYNVDFIGTQTDNGAGTLPDPDHEGHSGWRIGQLDANIAGWFGAMADPDVVLLHIGTNDFGSSTDTPNAINRLDALIAKIATLRPYAHIVVTNLMERNEPYNTSIQAQFNPFVQARVNAQAALGRRVTFLDMRAAVPLAEMPDQLHPGQTGYNHMADAWLPAIQAVIGIQGDAFAPAIVRAVGNGDRTHVAITFSKPVADSAAAVANFALSGGLTMSAAQLDAAKRTVTLTTSQQTLGASYTATVNGVTDRTPAALALPANSTVAFTGATPRGYLNNVPESAGYTLACSLDIPAVANFGGGAVPYAVDNRGGIGPFTRVAYYVELQTAAGDLQYVWASMNAFTTDAGKIGVPTLASGAVFQQGVAGMNVVSNAPGILTGTGLAGHLEFWPANYATANSAGVPGASDALYDFGDQPTPGSYGSMQLHHPSAAQTIFAFNNWGGTATATGADLGIGNSPAAQPDWTFANNAGNYTVRSLQVLVQTSGDATPPTLAAAVSFGRTTITVTFSEPLAGASVKAENFTLDGGVIVLGARLAANQRDVVLLTTAQPIGTPLTLTVNGVRDSSPSANRIAPSSTIGITAGALPASVAANVPESAGYQLVYSMNLPIIGNFNAPGGGYSVDNHLEIGAFSRVAYYVELRKTGDPAPTFVWAAMDAFTTDAGKIGIPTAGSGAVFQQNITNLNVVSNAAGIVTGTGIADGNIEFWPGNYAQANGIGIPNASAAVFDFGDTINTGTGYGSMQVHNHAAAAQQTLFALNRWGIDGNPLCLGIGNQPTGHPDWTFTDNAASYDLTRVLHVLVLPASSSDTTGPLMTAAKGSSALNRLVVSFNEPVADTAASIANFSIPGLALTGATLLAGQKEIALTTGAQTPGAVYVVSAGGVRDRTGNLILPGASATFTAVSAQPVLANIPEAAGYNLIYKLPIPNAATYNTNAVPYTIDESKYPQLQPFDRVAYCLELPSAWVFVSADAFAAELGRIGVPTLASGAVFQQNLSGMNVAASSGTGIVTGTALTGGNIEFWPTNYSAANGSGVPNASATNYDFGDTRTATGTYGSMQIHHHAASQTIFAYNNWGGSAGNSDLGIGNDPAPVSLGVDWTFHHNAATYGTKNLYVLARPGGPPAGSGPLLLSHPTSRTVPGGGSTTFAVAVHGAGPFFFQWRFNGAPIAGATNPWLDLIGVGNAQAGGYDVVVTASGGASTTSQTGTLTIVNHAPTFSGFAFTARKNHAAAVPRAGIVAKAADVDGDTLAITTANPASAQGGAVALGASDVTFTPAANFTGADSFTVTIADGFGGSVIGTVNVTVANQAGNAARQSTTAVLANGSAETIFYGNAGQLCEIQRSPDLIGWTTLQTAPAGDDGILVFTDPAPPAGKAFYRTRTMLP